MLKIVLGILVIIGLDLIWGLSYAAWKRHINRQQPDAKSFAYYLWRGCLGGLFEVIFALI